MHRIFNKIIILSKRNSLSGKPCSRKNILYENKILKHSCGINQSPKNYEDAFGNYGTPNLAFFVKKDTEDRKKINKNNQKASLSIKGSISAIKSNLENYKYKNALSILNDIQERTKAPAYIYKLMISYNGRLGNAKEAFHLYNEFKRRNYYVCNAIYTSMFNACANCQRTDVALEIAHKILEYLKTGEQNINISNYNAMLKAFGRHGDISTSLKIFDEVLKTKSKISGKTYNFLFDACLSDKNSGLRFAILVWHKMIQNNVKPSEYTFCILLRCVRECSLGDIELLMKLVNNVTEENKVEKKARSKLLIRPQSADTNMSIEIDKNLQIAASRNEESCESEIQINQSSKINNSKTTKMKLPNLLQIKHEIKSVTEFDDLSIPENRFLLFGGLKGFLNVVNHFKVNPDAKLFSLMLDCIPSVEEAEEDLIKEAFKHNVKLDTIFFNVLIKRRILRSQLVSVAECLDLLKQHRLSPDLVTFGTIALSCKTYESGMECIAKAREYGIRLNTIILGALLKNAKNSHDLKYVSDILAAAKEDEVVLNIQFISDLKLFIGREKELQQFSKSQ